MIICDPICTKMEHVPINTQIISNIVKEYKGKDIKLLCHESHWSHLSQSLSKEIKCSIKHIPIDVVSRKTKFKEWFKQLVTIRKIKSISSKNEPWIFLSTSVPLFWWFCFICKSHNPKMIFHSILAEVSGWIPRNPISALFTLRATFQNLHKRLPTTIVLEDYIRLNLIALNPQLQSKIFTLSHPLPDDNDTKITPNNKEIRIGFPGSFAKNKGANGFVTLAKKFKSNIKFSVIGKDTIGFKNQNQSQLFDKGPFDDYLSREEYCTLFNECDFIYLDQDKEHYQWTASGVLLDILHFGKPVIAKNNDNLFSFTKEFGDIGYLYSNEKELESILEKIILGSDDRIAWQGL